MSKQALIRSIKTKQDLAKELTDQLERSLMIEKIWPEAFSTGQAVKFSGITKANGRFISAKFTRKDGEVYPLSAEELRTFKPDVMIHQEFS